MTPKIIEIINERFNSLSGSFLVTDANAFILYANKAIEYKTGFSPAETVGKRPGSLWGGHMGAEFYKKMWLRIKQEKIVFSEPVANIKKNKKESKENLHITPVAGINGEIKFFIETQPAFLQENVSESVKNIFQGLSGHSLAGVENEILNEALKNKPTFAEFINNFFVLPTKEKYYLRQEDKELILKAKQDKAAFANIYLKYFNAVVHYFYSRNGQNSHAAEDLAQETFMRALGSIDSFQITNSSYLTYLLRIAHNILVNFFRDFKECKIDSIEDCSEGAIISRYKAELLNTEAELETALLVLSYEERQATKLKYQEGLSIREIACILNKSENAVKLNLSRARKKLKKTILEY